MDQLLKNTHTHISSIEEKITFIEELFSEGNFQHDILSSQNYNSTLCFPSAICIKIQTRTLGIVLIHCRIGDKWTLIVGQEVKTTDFPQVRKMPP